MFFLWISEVFSIFLKNQTKQLNRSLLQTLFSNQLICETCDWTFVNWVGLNCHPRSQIQQSPSKEPKVACPQCDKTFACRQNMNRHTQDIHDYVGHKSVKQCSLCPFKTKFILQLSLHFKKAHNELIHRICSYCITAFEDTESLYKHQEEVLGLPQPLKAMERSQPLQLSAARWKSTQLWVPKTGTCWVYDGQKGRNS